MRKIKILALAAAVFYLGGCTRISPTEAGFKISNSGNYRGIDSLPLLSGWQFYFPFNEKIVTIQTTMLHQAWTDTKTEGQAGEQAISIASMGGAGFRVDVGLNYHVDAFKASHIYLKWKEVDLNDITDKYIKNVVRGSMQDVSGRITLDSMLNNIPGFEHEAGSLIKDKLLKDGFILDGFNIISQPRPTDPNLSAAISAKIKSKQEAENSIMQLQTSIAEANKKIATARGDSASLVIEAAGQAEAIRLKQREITPTYVDYIKWSNWDGKLPTTMLSSNPSVLLNK